jgi:4-hydroxyphenylpyruvate dioxygenase-like putative hemolysin
MSAWMNDDAQLRAEAARIREERRAVGLEGQVGGLCAVILNVEEDRLLSAAEELLAVTGYRCEEAFEDDGVRCIVLAAPGSADILVRARTRSENPFAAINAHPRTRLLPNTRLETLVFGVTDLPRFAAIQRQRGIRFLTEGIGRLGDVAFLQTPPSPFTGNSIGFIEKSEGTRGYAALNARRIERPPAKLAKSHLANIGILDHVATRVTAADRDPAILEFMSLTNYDFDFAISVPSLNSITNVARMRGETFAYVFTSGIHPPKAEEALGPTEKFVQNYGARVHHVAFATEHIEETYDCLRVDGTKFLTELVGSPGEGLKQAFSEPSLHTFLVTEYIHRYGGFDGFFTKSNVTILTAATERQ